MIKENMKKKYFFHKEIDYFPYNIKTDKRKKKQQ